MPKAEKSKENKRNLQIQTNKLLVKAKKEPPSPCKEVMQPKADNETELLRHQIQVLQRKLDKIISKNAIDTSQLFEQIDTQSNCEQTVFPSRSHENASETSQLYRQNYEKEEMVLLKDDIYCRRTAYDSAIGSAFRASHMARRLIEGVFKTDAILQCTLSAQAPKAQGEERRKKKYYPLNFEARKAIIEIVNTWHISLAETKKGLTSIKIKIEFLIDIGTEYQSTIL